MDSITSQETGLLRHDMQNIEALHVVCGPHSPLKLSDIGAVACVMLCREMDRNDSIFRAQVLQKCQSRR
jgi:hypothetical protein